MKLFEDVIMDLMFTNDWFYLVCYGNDLTFGCAKFHDPCALPFFKLVKVKVICYYHDKF